jgi:hypothetical protein
VSAAMMALSSDTDFSSFRVTLFLMVLARSANFSVEIVS